VTSRSEIQSWKQFRAFSLLAMRICSCINEGYSWGFPGVYQQNRVWNIWDRVWKFQKWCAMTEVVSTEGELLDSCCDGAGKDAAQYPVIDGIV